MSTLTPEHLEDLARARLQNKGPYEIKLEDTHDWKVAQEVRRLREVLERLGSMEAFDVARGVRLPTDKELLARIDFARAALAGKEK
jgi:hypothetical protein